MDYQEFVKKTKILYFVEDDAMAEAAVKGVIGRLAGRLSEFEAHRLTDRLPEPLNYDKLRHFQVDPTPISAEQYVEDVRTQFRLSRENAKILIRTILHLTKDAVEKDILDEVEDDLPQDWRSILLQA